MDVRRELDGKKAVVARLVAPAELPRVRNHNHGHVTEVPSRASRAEMAQIVEAGEDIANRGLPRLQRTVSAPTTVTIARSRTDVQGSVGASGQASGRRVTEHSANASAASSSRRSAQLDPPVVRALSASSAPRRKSSLTHHTPTLQRLASEERAHVVFADAMATAGGVTVGGASSPARSDIPLPQGRDMTLAGGAGNRSRLQRESHGRCSSLRRWMRDFSRTWAFGCAVFGALLGGAIAIVLSTFECGICWAWVGLIE